MTTYDYYADDLLQKHTDPRGAFQTFSYNARHLVTAITQNKPAAGQGSEASGPNAIAKGSEVTFAYDAAGNRLSMQETINGVAVGRTDYRSVTSNLWVKGRNRSPMRYRMRQACHSLMTKSAIAPR